MSIYAVECHLHVSFGGGVGGLEMRHIATHKYKMHDTQLALPFAGAGPVPGDAPGAVGEGPVGGQPT